VILEDVLNSLEANGWTIFQVLVTKHDDGLPGGAGSVGPVRSGRLPHDRRRGRELMDPLKREFITRCSVAARMVAHPFPDMAGCEATLESQKIDHATGRAVVPFALSQLAVEDNNLFGMKAHQHNVYGVVNLPTHEYLSGEWTVVSASFEKYPTLDDCFADRYATLRRLSPIYPHYKAALAASDPYTFITEVSRTWSTDPNRAVHVIALYNEYLADKPNILVPVPPSTT
jgi:hypothetical protein